MANDIRYKFFEKIQDLLAVLRGIWFLLLFDGIAIFAFILAPQGTDVLLSVAEDFGTNFPVHIKPAPTIWLIIALICWSIAGEFCSRFLIYIADSSGRSLSPQRVDQRKLNQRYISNASLFFPSVLVILSFIKVFIVNYNEIKEIPQFITGILVIFIFLALLIFVLYKLYLGGWIVALSKKYAALQWLAISPRENLWVKKLYGIFNDVRIDIPESFNQYNDVDLPRRVVLPNGVVLPDSPYFQPYANNPQHVNNLKVWMFKINKKFYSCLLRQFYVLIILAVCIILLFGILLPVKIYLNIGAIALICFAFAAWQVIYALLFYADKIQTVFPVRFFLIALLVVSSFINKDHPVRNIKDDTTLTARPALQQHFNAWVNHLVADTLNSRGYYRVKDSLPVIFVAAEGGALRTGAFTAMMLGALTDSFPLLSKYIYCYSGVSGGTLGVNFYNAELIKHNLYHDTTRYDTATSLFFKKDFLAAVTGKLVFSEIINYFIPFHIPAMDRAIALEQGWEYGWKSIYKKDSSNILAASFKQTIHPMLPAIFINTTEVETGRQCIWSNVKPDSIPLEKERDIYARMQLNIPYSSAINLSTRFPLISPGAAFFYKDTTTHSKDSMIRRHYVDGGYYENKGDETLLQVLQAISFNDKKIKPYILQFNFSNADTTLNKGLKKFNEPAEILNGIYNTRGGRGDVASYYLKKYVDSLHGEFIDLQLTSTVKKVPMNWILSNTAVERIGTEIKQTIQYNADTLNRQDKHQLQKLFVYNKANLHK